MGEVIGKGFDKYVQEQVLKRQEKLRQGQIDIDVIKWNNTNNAFLRLSSGVNVSSNFVKDKLGLDEIIYKDNNLAKYFKLFAAQAYDGSTYNFTKGVGYNFQSSYGFASPTYTSYGLVPPPGLISADIKALNRGSLREANIQIKCHNLQQFQIIEALYLRLKYSILLEWGHSIYFDNNGNLIQSSHDLSDEFLSGNNNQTDILKKIQTEREASYGNYDAFFGLITNFEWTVRPDGGYDVSLRARSSGDVIESLKINTNTPVTTDNSSPASPLIFIQDESKSILNRLLRTISYKINNYGSNVTWAHGYVDTSKTYFPLNNQSMGANTGGGLKTAYDRSTPPYQDKKDKYLTDYEARTFTNVQNLSISKADYNRLYYIKLGTLLRFIESFTILYDSSTKTSNNNPLFNIDYNFDTNYCFSIPYHFSSDPRICLIPYPTANSAKKLASGQLMIETFRAIGITYDLDPQYSDPNTSSNVDLYKSLNSALNSASKYTVYQLTNSGANRCIYTYRGTTTGPGLYTGSKNSAGTQANIPNTTKTYDTDYKSYIESTDINTEPGRNTFIYDGVIPAVNDLKNSTSKIDANFSPEKYVYAQWVNTVYYKFIVETITTELNGTILSKKTTSKLDNSTGTSTPNPSYTQNSTTSIDRITGQTTTILTEEYNVTAREYYLDVAEFSNTAATGFTSATLGGIYKTLEADNNDSTYPWKKDLYDEKEYTGRTMNMLVNIEYIAKILRNNINVKEGSINLYEFLDKLMAGIQNALGNINKFEVIYKEDTNAFKIIDSTLIPGQFNNQSSPYDKKIVEFLIASSGSLGTTGGSFITDFNFKTKLSNNFSTMVTVGAQANGAVVGSDATALSKWNDGLTDRIIPERSNPNGVITNTTNAELEYQTNLIKIQKFLLNTNDGIVTDEEISSIINIVNDIFKTKISASTLEHKTKGNNNGIPGIGFIPFDLELNMIGLSGPRIYESYTIDTRLLPKSYQDSIQFICSGVSHNISNGEWKTTLNSICGPKQEGVVVGKMKPGTPIVSTPPPPPAPASSGKGGVTLLDCEATKDGCSPQTKPLVDQSQAKPNIPNSKNPGVRAGVKLADIKDRNQEYIFNEYLATLEKMPEYSSLTKGFKVLMTSQAINEGFYPNKKNCNAITGKCGTRAYRTNNPGNINNTDTGNENAYSTLEEGIRAQIEYIKDSSEGNTKAHKFRKVSFCRSYSPELKECLPAFEFEYKGEIGYYLFIYATAPRISNNYLENILGFYKYNGIDVNYKNTIKEIINIT